MRFAGLLISFTFMTCCLGCSSERALEPKPVRSLLYASQSGGYHGSIDVIDCETDSLIKTITDTLFRQEPTPVASPDGKYLMINGGPGALIWDVRQERVVAILSPDVFQGVFVPDRDLLIGIAWSKTFVYHIPDGALLGEYDIELYQGVRIAGTSWIIGYNRYTPHLLEVFDYDSGTIVDTIELAIGDGAERVEFIELAASPTDMSLYATVDNPGSAVIRYDLASDSIRFISEALGPFTCAVSPDGAELWTTEMRSDLPFGFDVVIRDGDSGLIIKRIETSQYGEFWLDKIAFSESEDKAYVRARYRPTLVVDLSTRAIMNSIIPSSRGGYTALAVIQTSY